MEQRQAGRRDDSPDERIHARPPRLGRGPSTKELVATSRSGPRSADPGDRSPCGCGGCASAAAGSRDLFALKPAQRAR
jgi:hypothetical protein